MFSAVASYILTSWLYTVKTYHTNGVLYGTVGVLITQIRVYIIGILQCKIYYTFFSVLATLSHYRLAKKAFYCVAAAVVASKCWTLQFENLNNDLSGLN